MAKKVPPARLDPVIYDAWLGENPKLVEGGPLELVPCEDSSSEDAVNLEIHSVSSDILDYPHADDLCIYGYHNRYEGFKIYVNNRNGYLLMAHQTHANGPFRADDGRTFGDHPHFHQIDFYRRIDGVPGTRRKVPSSLHEGMDSAELLEAFLCSYYFDDGRTETIEMPSKKQLQRGLVDFYE